MTQPKIIVVGGGLAGLMAAMKVAEGGLRADLFSVVPVRRSHSVCAQGGINAAVNTKGEGDSPAQHLDDTIYGGDFLANQTPVKNSHMSSVQLRTASERSFVFGLKPSPLGRWRKSASHPESEVVWLSRKCSKGTPSNFLRREAREMTVLARTASVGHAELFTLTTVLYTRHTSLRE